MKGYNNDYDDGIIDVVVSDDEYNIAGSNSVKEVDSAAITSNLHDVPKTGEPNSVSKNYKDGKLNSERYYGSDGRAYLDIDYSDHGNPKTHPIVPHEHDIWYDNNGGFHRGKDNGINK